VTLYFLRHVRNNIELKVRQKEVQVGDIWKRGKDGADRCVIM